MKKGFFLPFILLATFSGCMSQLASLRDGGVKTQNSFDDMRMEIAELKHTLHAQQVDMQIMEEKLSHAKPMVKNFSDDKIGEITDRLHRLETSLAQMQRFQETCLKDLKNLHDFVSKANQIISSQNEQINLVQNELSLQTKKLQDVKDLKSTLSSLKKAIAEPSSPIIYKVKAGDSIEKIARVKGISTEELRKLNRLQSDIIFVGQELVLGYEKSE